MPKQAGINQRPDVYVPPTCVYGVDFSGAADAGKHIWVTEGVVKDGCLHIQQCLPATSFLDISPARDVIFPALVDFVGRQKVAAFGFDFPFGLPGSLIAEESWAAFVAAFPSRYPSLADFDADCHAASDGREWKRLCDVETRAPFSPYNRRVVSQTYYGIRDLLYPLVVDGRASVPPIHCADPNVPWLLEVCPAGALKDAGLYKPPYKGRTGDHYDARRHILDTLEADGVLRLSSSMLRDTILSNAPGDALDSVVAALVAFKTVRNPKRMTDKSGYPYTVEGCIYV